MSEFTLPSYSQAGSLSFSPENTLLGDVTSNIKSIRQAYISAPGAIQQNKGTPETLNTIEQAKAIRGNLVSQGQELLARANAETQPEQKQIYLQAYNTIRSAIQKVEAKINELEQSLTEQSNMLTENTQQLIELRKRRDEFRSNLKGISFDQVDRLAISTLPLVPTKNPLLP